MDYKKKKYDAICIGQIINDLLVTGIPGNALTETKDTYIADSFTSALGGDAANESVVLAKLGNKVALLGKLGDDQTGHVLLNHMEENHVDPSLTLIKNDCINTRTVVVILKDSSHRYFVCKGRNFNLSKEDIDFSILSDTRAIITGSLFGLGELDLYGIGDVFSTAQKNGVLVFADMTYDMDGIGPRAFDHIYGMIDYLLPSYDEALYVTECEEPEKMAQFFLERGTKNVVIKLGGKGCYFKNNDMSFYTDPFIVEPVNMTGCGDNFVAGFAHSILKRDSVQEACRFACGVGALNALGIGANLFVKNEQHVLKFMSMTPQLPIER